MSFHDAMEIVGRLRAIAEKRRSDILHGHGTVEDMCDELESVAKEIEES